MCTLYAVNSMKVFSVLLLCCCFGIQNAPGNCLNFFSPIKRNASDCSWFVSYFYLLVDLKNKSWSWKHFGVAFMLSTRTSKTKEIANKQTDEKKRRQRTGASDRNQVVRKSTICLRSKSSYEYLCIQCLHAPNTKINEIHFARNAIIKRL